MGSVRPYETAKGRRYRVRYRRPDHTETEKRGFTTMREAQLYLSTVTVSKSQGDYVDPVSSRIPLRMFAESWLRAKQPPMTKPLHYATLEQSWRNHVAPIWADGGISSIRRSEVQTGYPSSRRAGRARSSSAPSGSWLACSTSRSMIVVSRVTRRGTCATFLGTVRASVASTSRTTRWRRSQRAPRTRRSS